MVNHGFLSTYSVTVPPQTPNPATGGYYTTLEGRTPMCSVSCWVSYKQVNKSIGTLYCEELTAEAP